MFADRNHAGKLLTAKLTSYNHTGIFVIGLARGGMIVASRIAKLMSLPLDVLVVKKIPAPGNAELALGAVAPDGITKVNWRLVQQWGVDEKYMRTQISTLADTIAQKTLLYRKGKKPLIVKDKMVILVDDGAATGATMEAAIKWCKAKKARKIVAAIPVASREAAARITPEVREAVVLETPENFNAVGQFYREFSQVEDEEVIQLLRV